MPVILASRQWFSGTDRIRGKKIQIISGALKNICASTTAFNPKNDGNSSKGKGVILLIAINMLLITPCRPQTANKPLAATVVGITNANPVISRKKAMPNQ
jgi:hypothetical protein